MNYTYIDWNCLNNDSVKKYTKEQLENPSEEISEDVYRIATMYALEKIEKKPVWFMISEEEYGKYYINMYYDNGYNRANGEDL